MKNDINILNDSRPQYGAIYFLGSGASAPYGAPTFSNFYEKSLDISKNIDNDKTYQEVLNEWRSKFSDYNIEEYFSTIEMSEMITSNRNIATQFIPVSTQKLTNFIAKTIEKSLAKASFIKDYRRLIQSLDKFDAIVTTNWDILLETEILQKLENWEFNYISVTPYDPEGKKKQPSYASIPLFKLHGSLNWAQCQGCHKVYYFYEKVYSRFYEEPASIPECYICNKPNKQLLPIIVPPTFSKLKNNVFTASDKEWEQSKFLNNIWSDAYYRIAFSKEIYFVGYSFPQTDAQMKIFVSMALKANTSLKKIVVVSNEKFGHEKVNFEENYRPIIKRCVSKPKVEFRYDGFSGFCEEIINEKIEK